MAFRNETYLPQNNVNDSRGQFTEPPNELSPRLSLSIDRKKGLVISTVMNGDTHYITARNIAIGSMFKIREVDKYERLYG